MKKIFLLSMLMGSAMMTMADTAKDDIIDNGYRWYVQGHLTGSMSANENLRFADFKKSLGWGADLSVGYNFNDYWGMYGQIAFNSNRSGIAYESSTISFDNYKFTTIDPSLNVTYNVANGIGGYIPGRKHNVYLHAGVGAAFTTKIDASEQDAQLYGIMTGKQTTWAGNVGVNYTYNFNNKVALTADVTGHVMGDKVNGQVCELPFDGRINLGVGVRFYLGRSKKAAMESIVENRTVYINDTVRTKKEIVVNEQDVFPIFFSTNSSEFGQAQTASLKDVADALKKSPSKVVYVLGYADKDTEADNNSALAKTRADIVTAELINKYGIDQERIVTHDMGDKVQPYLNLTEKNRATLCIITDLKHQ